MTSTQGGDVPAASVPAQRRPGPGASSTRQASDRSRLRLAAAMELLDQVHASVVVTDLEGHVSAWNSAAERLFGWTREEAIGRSIGELTVMPDDADMASEIMAQLAAGERWEGQFQGRRKDGTPIELYVHDSPLVDDNGDQIGILGVAMDVTRQVRQEAERSDLLARERAARAEAELLNGIALAAAGEDDLSRILAVTLERLAGQVRFTGGSIALIEVDELVVRAAIGPFAMAAMGSRLQRGRGRTWQVIETLQPYRSDDLRREGVRVVTEGVGEGGIRSYLAVPLIWREHAIGVLEVDATHEAAFTEDDQRLVERVAIALSGPVELARRHGAEADARRAAERTTQRISRLQATTAALAQAQTRQQVADALMEQGLLDSLGASAGSVALLNDAGDALEIVRAVGYPTEMTERFHVLPLDGDTPLAVTARSRHPVLLGSVEDLGRSYERLVPEAARTGNRAMAAFPLLSGDRVLGAIGLSYPKEQAFDDEEQAYLLAVAQQCSQAMERARLYDAERVAESRLSFLGEASAKLAGSLDYEATLRALADLAVPRLADWCIVDLLEDDDSLQPVAIAHVDPAKVELAREYRRRFPPQPGEPQGALAVARTGRSVLFPVITDEMIEAAGMPAEQAEVILRLGLQSALIVPLAIHDRTIGALSLVTDRPGRTLGQADLEMAEELGRRAAVAVDTARVHRELSRFKTTLDGTLDSVFMFDPQTLRHIYANQGAVDSHGFQREELLAMTPLDLKLEFDEARYRALIEPLIDGSEPSATVSTMHRRKDGTTMPVEVFLQYVAPEGEPPRMVAIARDITDRIEARVRLQRLAQSERALSAELKAIIRAMGEAVLVFAPDRRLIFSNPAAEALFPDHPIGSYEDVAAHLAEPDELPGLGVPYNVGPVELRTTDPQERWLEVSAYPVAPPMEAVGEAGDTPVQSETILFLRDATAGRQARQARDAFIGVLSHELRTPVTTIYGNSKLLGRSEERPDEVRREVIADIEMEAERLYRLVEDLLVLARFGGEDQSSLGNEPLLLQRLVPAVVRSEQGRWPATTIEQTLEPALPAAKGEQTYVEQVVRNLVNNAAKYSGPGARVEVLARRTGEEVQVTVLDEGPGFPATEQGRLFELFYRSPHTATRASGAGIGLFVCKRLIEAMGGRIWARPRSAKGAEFGFALKVFTEEET